MIWRGFSLLEEERSNFVDLDQTVSWVQEAGKLFLDLINIITTPSYSRLKVKYDLLA